MTGRVVVITGGNAGIGFETARVLAEKNATVVMGCRSEKRAQAAIDRIREGIKEKGGDQQARDARIEFIPLDTASFKSAKKFSEAFISKFQKLDVLVLNAGKIQETPALSEEGFEWMFGAHHMGHFYLTHLLGGKLKEGARESGDARVVVVSSCAHQLSVPEGIDFKNLKNAGEEGETQARRFAVYGQSKLANALFVRKLSQRIEKSEWAGKIVVNAVHPGFVRTDLSTVMTAAKAYGLIYDRLTFSPLEGALTQIFLASSQSPSAKKGDGYFFPIASPAEWKRDTSPFTQDWEMIDRLWDFSVEESKKIDNSFRESF